METSYLSKQPIPLGEEVKGEDIRSSVFQLIQENHPGFNTSLFISIAELNQFRRLYLSTLIEKERGELAALDSDVMNAIKNNSILSESFQEEEKEDAITFGERVADKVASFGGSWTFIIFFFLFILGWMIINTWLLITQKFDPFPFILLNLILSCLAAIQAPIIMMSQNRQEEKDRERAKKDYMINLKSELEIRILHEKLDHLIMHQQQELFEIQKVQIEMMNDILREVGKN